MSNSSLIITTHRSHRSTTTDNNKNVKKRKEGKRICSTCGSTKTRLHHWGPRRKSDGDVAAYPQWYNDHEGGWLCYSCYMKDYWKKRRRKQEQEKKEKK
jgi:hypothetical protein